MKEFYDFFMKFEFGVGKIIEIKIYRNYRNEQKY